MKPSSTLLNPPVAAFTAFFQFKQDDGFKISFMAVINSWRMAKTQKFDAKVTISSENQPLDTVSIESAGIDEAILPTRFQQGKDVFTYLPGQCLMIKGNTQQHGDYHILVFPKMTAVVML